MTEPAKGTGVRNRDQRMQFGVGRAAGLLAVICLAGWPSAAMGQATGKAVKVGTVAVRAVADREAVVAGEAFNVAVVLKMDKGWHVYWANPGGPGLPTETKWTLPAGYSAGRTQYPAPVLKFDKLLKENSFIHEGKAVFVTRIKAPASAAAGSNATFKVEVSWLACKKTCIPGSTTLSMSLPVVAKGTAAKRANKDLFEAARDALPTPGAKAKHIKLGGRTDKKSVKPGDKFTATLTVEIAAKHHMQSHKPLQDYLIPAVVFVESPEGFEIGDVVYPKGHLRDDKVLGEKLSEYSGRISFGIPVELDADGENLSQSIRGVLQYQICTDSGTCYPPEAVSFEIAVPMGGAGAPAEGPSSTGGTDEAPSGASELVVPPDDEDRVAPPSSHTASASGQGTLDRIQQWFIEKGYYGVLFLAFMGGLILNLMPCVLPVISLKVLSFVKQAGEDRSRILALGLTYCAGIMVFFSVISGLYYYWGKGWGELFQEPEVILILSAVVTAFALSLFGVFAVFTPQVINQLGAKAEEREGLPSAFFTGVLATFLGTACTAPFLSAAIGTASKYPAMQGAGIFMAVGVGMMFPFLILSAKPGWLKFVPKPGPWMGTFEMAMGLLLLATVIWLINPLGGQIGAWGMLLALMFLLGVAVAVWVRGKAQFSREAGRKFVLNATALALLALAWLFPFQWMSTVDALEKDEARREHFLKTGIIAEIKKSAEGGRLFWPPPFVSSDEIFWVPYDEELVRQFVEGGYTVFVDFTADWCVSCKANLKTSIDVDSTVEAVARLNVVTFEADYTRKDATMKRILASFDRAGVPMYLVYSPNDPDDPRVLPELLTPQIVLNALEAAGPSETLPQ